MKRKPNTPAQAEAQRRILGDDHLLSPAEVSRIYKVRVGTVRGWLKTGRVEAIKTPTGQWRIRASVIDAHLNGHPAPAEATS